MNFIEKLMELRHPERLIWFLGSKGGLNWMNDSMYIKMSYYFRMNKKLDLKKPITYNEKLQWLKINNRNYMYTNLADKYEVRKLIKEKIGSDKLITLLEVKDKPEQINWDALPNQFVAKCNHDSGGVVICKDKKKFIVSSAEKKLNKSLSNNYYYPGREWPYKNIKPRIIIEEYMEDDSGGLNDFKIMCFNGEPKIIQVMSERDDGDFLISHFDLDWNMLNIPRKSIKEDTKVIKKPDTLNEMIEISKILSENIPFVRIDLYEVEGSVYFGECTFFPTSGFMDFKNIEDDELLGSWIRLSDNDEYFDTSIIRKLPKRWYD